MAAPSFTLPQSNTKLRSVPSDLTRTPLEELQTQLIDLEKSYHAERRNVATAIRQVQQHEDAMAKNFYTLRQTYLVEIDKRLGSTGSRPGIHRAYLIAKTDYRGKVVSYGVFSEERPSPMIGDTGGQILIDKAESILSYDAAVNELMKKVRSVA
jgi:hypothetical protein